MTGKERRQQHPDGVQGIDDVIAFQIAVGCKRLPANQVRQQGDASD